MYQRVVVPLDGSDLAELALPHLEAIAKGCSIPDVFLVSVTELVRGEIGSGTIRETFVPEKPVAMRLPDAGVSSMAVLFDPKEYGLKDTPVAFGKMLNTANDYLCRKAEELECQGFRVTATVLMGDPAAQIARFAQEKDADVNIPTNTSLSHPY